MATTEPEIRKLVRQLRALTASSPDAWADIDLTFIQLRALFVLATGPRMRVSDLADALDMSLASASALSERLVRLGYVTRDRDGDDHRIVLLRPAAKGQRVLDRLDRRSRAQLSDAIHLMTEAERAALVTSLRAFLRVAAARSARPASGTRARRSA